MIERTDGDGRWESADGASWTLVEPSPAWRADQEAETAPAPPTPAVLAAEACAAVASLPADDPARVAIEALAAAINP